MNIVETATCLASQGITPIPFVLVEDQKKKTGFTKRPSISSWRDYQNRTMRAEEVSRYFTEQTDLIGILTGRLSGIIVVDIDNYDNGNTYGLSSTLTATTMNGGLHLYFKYREGVQNSVKFQGKNLDIRSEGGLIAIPPSAGYSWNREVDMTKLRELFQTLPDFPVELMVKPHESAKVDIGQMIGTSEGNRDDTITRAAMSAASSVVWKNSPLQFEQERLLALNSTFDPPLPETLVLQKLDSGIRKATLEKTEKSKLRSVRTMSDMVVGRLEDRELEKEAMGTGMARLDEIIKGFVPKHYYTMTGDTNVGKTTLALNFSYNLVTQGKKVLYFALEPENTVVDYIASIRLKKPFHLLQSKDLDWDNQNIHFATKDDGLQTLSDLVRKIHESDRYDLIVIDHVGYFVNGNSGNYIQEQSNMIKELVQEAKRKHCAILGIAHLKKPDKKKNGEVSDLDIAGSNAFRTDSTDVLVASRLKEVDGTWKNEGVLYVTKTKCSAKGGGMLPIFFQEGGALISDKPIPQYADEELSIFL